jgi:NADPH-dependent curcumin reductase CurA
MTQTTRRIVLKSRPDGLPVPDNFEIETVNLPTVREGEILVKNEYLGLAPSSRIRMSEIKSDASYAEPTPIGGVIYGQSLGRIVQSRNPRYKEGERVVLTAGGWQEMSVSDGSLTTRIDETKAGATQWLGALGVSGLTAYVGLFDVGGLKPNDRVAVSAASGAVGAMACQIAKAKGCHVVGIAGGPEKCRYLVDELGLDAAVDYRAADYGKALDEACAAGVDLFFDNVGGSIRADILARMNNFGRIVVCGMIAEYNSLSSSTGPGWLPILTKRLTVRGFLMRDHVHLHDDFVRDVGGWIAEGKIKPREDIVEGFENTPQAFIGMLSGRNFGKTIVRL